MSRFLVVGLDTPRVFVYIVNVPDVQHAAVQRDRDAKYERYERDDPETGDPLPAGVDGYHLGRRREGR